MAQWIYFADGTEALIRVPAMGEATLKDRPGERYWGRGNWFARSAGCGNWTDTLASYRQIDETDVPAIVEYIDNMPGGTFRDRRRFWPDKADRWSLQRARERAAKLNAETGPDSDHWTVQEYLDDIGELRRLEAFIAAPCPTRGPDARERPVPGLEEGGR